MIKTYIPRDDYLKKITPFIDKEVIKVIVGQRRVGKSYLLYQIMDKIKRSNSSANIIYINKELYEFDNLIDYHDLLNYIKQRTVRKSRNYVFIDEIQEISQFEQALRHLNTVPEYDVYCTGSNANLLSGELATLLSGRYVEIPVYSLSYAEFLKFHKLKNGKDSLLKYIKYGGLPYLIHLPKEDDIVCDYLRNIYNTIILKDVVARYNLRNINFLERLTEYLADNIGGLVSAKKISDFLKSQRISISPNTILNYLTFLGSAYFIFKTPRVWIGSKKVFEINEKYYFGDLGLRHALIGYRQVDINKVLENLVFSQLKFQGYKVSVGQLTGKEIDFVAEKHDRKIYIQTAYLITDKKTKEREFGNLLAIKDNYPKTVVSMDELAAGEYKGINHINILDFLLEKSF